MFSVHVHCSLLTLRTSPGGVLIRSAITSQQGASLPCLAQRLSGVLVRPVRAACAVAANPAEVTGYYELLLGERGNATTRLGDRMSPTHGLVLCAGDGGVGWHRSIFQANRLFKLLITASVLPSLLQASSPNNTPVDSLGKEHFLCLLIKVLFCPCSTPDFFLPPLSSPYSRDCPAFDFGLWTPDPPLGLISADAGPSRKT